MSPISKSIVLKPMITVFLALVVTASFANALTLESPSTLIVQQTTQNPCIFGDPSCSNPAGFDYTLFPSGGTVTDYMEFSPLYTVQELTDVANSTAFDLGIDVNTARGASGPEILELFQVFVNGVIQFSFTDGVDGDGTLFAVNNGTGYSDSRLMTVDLTAFAPTDVVQFYTHISRATDGRENIFIISADATPIPEPASAMLLGLGVLAAARRRKKA